MKALAGGARTGHGGLPRPHPARGRARARPPRAHDPRGEGGADARPLEGQGEDHRRAGPARSRGRPAPARERAGAAGAADRAEGQADQDPARSPRGRRLHQCRAEVAGREHAPGHPRADPRGGAPRPGRAQGHELPHPDRARQHLGSRARGKGDERRRSGSAGARDARGALARPRPGPRPAVGSHRGDLRRRSVPRLASRRGRDPRVSGDEPHAGQGQGPGHGQALRRPRAARRRHQHRAHRVRGAPAPRPVPVPVRGRDLGDPGDGRHAVLQRDGRRALAQEPLAAPARAPPGVGLRRDGRLRLLRDRPDGVAARSGRRPCRRGAAGHRGRRGRRAARHRRLREAGRPREGRAPLRIRPRPCRRAHPAREVPGRPLRGSLRRPRSRAAREQHARAPGGGAGGGAARHRPPEERRGAPAPGPREAEDDRGHRAQRQGRPPGRLFQRAGPRRGYP